MKYNFDHYRRLEKIVKFENAICNNQYNTVMYSELDLGMNSYVLYIKNCLCTPKNKLT